MGHFMSGSLVLLDGRIEVPGIGGLIATLTFFPFKDCDHEELLKSVPGFQRKRPLKTNKRSHFVGLCSTNPVCVLNVCERSDECICVHLFL